VLAASQLTVSLLAPFFPPSGGAWGANRLLLSHPTMRSSRPPAPITTRDATTSLEASRHGRPLRLLVQESIGEVLAASQLTVSLLGGVLSPDGGAWGADAHLLTHRPIPLVPVSYLDHSARRHTIS
jgi:hypothetical protein